MFYSVSKEEISYKSVFGDSEIFLIKFDCSWKFFKIPPGIVVKTSDSKVTESESWLLTFDFEKKSESPNTNVCIKFIL